MAIDAIVKRFASAFLGGGAAARQIVLPAAAVGAPTVGGAAFTYGAWVDVALPAAVLVPTLVVAVVFDQESVLEEYTVDIGSALGYANAAAVIAAGAGAIAAAHRAEVRVNMISLAGNSMYVPLAVPVYYPAATGILARNYTVGGGDTIGVTVVCVQGF